MHLRSDSLKQGAKLADILHVCEPKNLVNKGSAMRRPEGGRHQVTSFCNNFITAHWVFGSATHSRDTLDEASPIGQRDLDDRYPLGYETLKFLVGDELNLGTLAEDSRVLHSCFVVRGTERHCLVDQHYCDNVLEANIRQFAIIHSESRARGSANYYLPYLIGFKGVPF